MASSSGTKPPRQPPIMSSWLRDLIYGVGVEVEVGIGSSVDVPPRPSVIARPPSEGSVYPQPYCLEEFLRKPILPPGTPIPPDPLDDPNNFIVLSVSCLPACYTSLVEQLGYKELLDFRVRLDNLDALGIRFGIHGIFVSGTNQPGCNDMSVYHSTPVAIEVVYALLDIFNRNPGFLKIVHASWPDMKRWRPIHNYSDPISFTDVTDQFESLVYEYLKHGIRMRLHIEDYLLVALEAYKQADVEKILYWRVFRSGHVFPDRINLNGVSEVDPRIIKINFDCKCRCASRMALACTFAPFQRIGYPSCLKVRKFSAIHKARGPLCRKRKVVGGAALQMVEPLCILHHFKFRFTRASVGSRKVIPLHIRGGMQWRCDLTGGEAHPRNHPFHRKVLVLSPKGRNVEFNF